MDYKPQKYDPYPTHLTVGGNLIKYPGEVSTLTVGLTMEKNIDQQYYFKPIGALHVL